VLTLSADNSAHIDVTINNFDVIFESNMPDWFGTEDITFYLDDNVNDSGNRDIVSQIISVIINSVNDPPVIILPDEFEFAEDSTLIVDFEFESYISDIEGDDLTLYSSGNDSIFVDIVGTIVTFSTGQDWFGNEMITFIVDDNQTDATASDSVDVIVTPVNDSPILSIVGTFEADEDSVSQTYDFAPFCTQTWGETDVLTLTADNSEHIDVTIIDFDVTFASNTLNWFGSEDITFYLDDNVNDAGNRDIVNQTISVTIYPINDPPYFTSIPDTLSLEDDVYSYTVTASDIDEDSLSFNAAVIPEWLTFVSVIGLLTGIPTNDEVGYHDITLTVTDSIVVNPVEQSFILHVENVNDPPVIILPESFSFQQYSSSTYDFTEYVWDIDNTYEELLLTWLGNDNIEIAFDDWLITFSSNNPEWTGFEEITFTVDDGENVIIYRSSNETKSSLKNTERILQPDRDEVSDMVTVFCEEVESEEILIPTKTELCGNYPNPFNPETIISFGLKEDSHVILHIYNIKGQLVTTLLNENLLAGYHKILWSGKNSNGEQVASGLYLYRMTTEDFSKIKKMLFLK